MCISNAAMIPNPKLRRHGSTEEPKKKKKILKPKPVNPNEKAISVLTLLSTFVNVKAVSGLNEVSVGTKAFISILKHAKTCRSCSDIKCKKMKMVLAHFNQCSKLKIGENCSLCSQLLKVVAQHSLYLCPNRAFGVRKSCPVPFCDPMRAAKALKV